MRVLYYPDPEQSKKCKGKKELPADVIEINQGRRVDLRVICPSNGVFDAYNVPHKINEGDNNCWEFTEEYERG